MSTQPPIGTKLGLKQTISMVLSFDADETTVNVSTVRLFLNAEYDTSVSGSPVPGKVSYDPSSKSINFVPVSPLASKWHYTLTLRGIKDSSGEEMPAVELIFETYSNRGIRQVEFEGSSMRLITIEPNGDQRSMWYNDAGPDGQWFTGDDALAYYYYTTFTETASNTLLKTVAYIGAGTDGIWFTADDVADRCFTTQTVLDKQGRYGREAFFAGPAQDCGSDNAISSYTTYEYDAKGRLKLVVYYEQPGLDKKWFTEDDTISYYLTHSEDVARHAKYFIQYTAGADAVWFTADDEINNLTKIYRDPDTPSFSTTTYGGPGPDQAWFTEDDLPNYHESTTFNVDGVMLAYKTFQFFGAGVDALPGTEDDQIAQSITAVDIESDTTKYINFTGRGQDNTLFTADDPVSDYKITKIVSNNSQEQRSITTHYTNAGADGVWFTDDDIIGSYQITEYAENGNRVLFLEIDGAGPDGFWFTEDDNIIKRIEYDPLN